MCANRCILCSSNAASPSIRFTDESDRVFAKLICYRITPHQHITDRQHVGVRLTIPFPYSGNSDTSFFARLAASTSWKVTNAWPRIRTL